MNTEPVYTNTADLVKYLLKLRSTQVATITAITDVRLNKNGNPYVGVRKVQRIKVEINNNYENKVNDGREVEGKRDDFEVAPLQWGEHVSNAVIENGGKLYLQTIVLEKDSNPVYIDARGFPVSYEDIRPFFPPYRPNARQGLDEEVKVRTWKLESIYDMWLGERHLYKAINVQGPR